MEVDGRPLAFNPTPKFLGIKFDRMFSFAEQAKEVAARMTKGSGVLKALAGSDWGWRGDLLRRVYHSVLQSVSDYCAAGWQPWLSPAGVGTLDQARNKCLRVITGQYSTTPLDVLRLEAGTEPVKSDILRSAASAYEKSKRLPASNPRTVVASGEPHKWKRQVGWRLVAKTVVDELELESFPRLPLPPPTFPTWRMVGGGWGIALSLQGESRRMDPPDKLFVDALATGHTAGSIRCSTWMGPSKEQLRMVGVPLLSLWERWTHPPFWRRDGKVVPNMPRLSRQSHGPYGCAYPFLLRGNVRAGF